MKRSLVLTVIGLDEPGLVKAISDAVLRHRANWEASRMARLAGRFAGILLVTVDDGEADQLVASLRGLQERGLKVVVEASADEERPRARSLRLDLIGNDRPGITREIAHALAARGVNVDELSTHCEAAPMSGGMLFKLTADLQCPASVDLAELRASLETIANDLMIDLDLRELGEPRK
jgi:glycine cleavage system regulatory protein